MKLVRLVTILAVALAVLHLMAGASAQGTADRVQLGQTVERWQRTIESITRKANLETLTSERSQRLQSQLQEVIAEAEEIQSRANARLRSLRLELESLGPAPGEGEPRESEDVAALRQGLAEEIAIEEGRASQAGLTIVRAREALRALAEAEEDRLRRRLLDRGPSPIWPGVWTVAAGNFAALIRDMYDAPIAWWKDHEGFRTNTTQYLYVAGAIILTLFVALPLRFWLLRRFARDPSVTEPSSTRRIVATFGESLARALLPSAALLVLLGTLTGQGLVRGLFAAMIEGAVLGTVFFLLVSGLAHAALSPRLPAWRIVPATPEGAVVLNRRITALAAVSAIALFSMNTAETGGPVSPEFQAAARLAILSTLSVLLLSLLPARFWRRPEEKTTTAIEPLLRLVLGVAIVAAPLCVLAGYDELGTYILGCIVLTAFFVGGALLLRTVLSDGLTQLLTPEGRLFPRVQRTLKLSENAGRRLSLWGGIAIDLLIALPVLYLLLRLYGVPAAMMNLWITELMTGVSIGGVTFALYDVFAAVLVFCAILVIFRFLRRMLNERILAHTHLDRGVKNSLSAAFGYLGVIIAAALAIGALGLDLSNLALIAGALSVGIGFGLRTVVENFVAGLLLLIERPIKVGDWIIAGAHEGMVKRISVRATEIECFDRSEVIIPNSELISAPVVNWTHKSRVARIGVKVGVAYGSDTEKVERLLLECAKGQKHVLLYPEPYVLFTEFGDSSLNFELRCYISDTDYVLTVSSDLHFAVDKTFREHGIEIPFPQRTLHVQSVPDLKTLAAERSDGQQPLRQSEPRAQRSGLARRLRGEIAPDSDS